MQLDKNPKPLIHYPLILLLIIVGVTIGNLLSGWIGAEIAEYRLKKALGASNQALALQLDKVKKAEQISAQHAAIEADNQKRAEENMRRESVEGQRLYQQCEEWRRTDAQIHSYTTTAEVNKQCGRFDRFVATGSIQ